MSEGNGHNGPHPEHLSKLLGQIKGMAREARRSVSKRRNRVYAGGSAPEIPRQVCLICGTAFDFCKQTNPEPPKKSQCGDCKNMLVSGWTAFITAQHHAWVKPGPTSHLKPGQVYVLTDEAMIVVMKRFKDQQPNGQNPTPEAGR